MLSYRHKLLFRRAEPRRGAHKSFHVMLEGESLLKT